jgi:hypothetical protein
LSGVGSVLPTICKINSLRLILKGNRQDDLTRKVEQKEEEEEEKEEEYDDDEKEEENKFQIYLYSIRVQIFSLVNIQVVRTSLSKPVTLITNIMFLTIIHHPLFIENTILFIFKNTTFRRLDSISVFRQNLLSWAQS